MSIEVTIDSSYEAARAALSDWVIEKPGPMLADDAARMLSDAEEALNEDPDVDANERAHEAADASYDASDYVKDTPEVFDLDDEGLAGDNPTPREKVSAAIYNLLRGICSAAIEEHRPSADEMDWSDAHGGSRGDVLIGKSSDEGFVYVRAELRRKDWGVELAISGQTRYSAGQIDMHLSADDFEPAPGWTHKDLRRLFAIWDRWHLNGTKAACEHQQNVADRLGRKPHELFATRYQLEHNVDAVGRFTGYGYEKTTGKQASQARVRCAICGHDYGSGWLRRELPADVIEFIESRFPATRERA